VFAVLEPAALAATAQALAEAEAHHRARLAAFELAVERARDEADRARRQFDNVSRRTGSWHAPWNVRWKTSSARSGGQRTIWSPSAPAVPRCSPTRNWPGYPAQAPTCAPSTHAPTTTARERKQLLRALITE
jgi:hypothetical protein